MPVVDRSRAFRALLLPALAPFLMVGPQGCWRRRVREFTAGEKRAQRKTENSFLNTLFVFPLRSWRISAVNSLTTFTTGPTLSPRALFPPRAK